jgi:CDP-diacylglycerol--serine O-phosphatidyltransferase
MTAAWRKIIPCSFTFAALCAGVGSILAAGAGSFLLSAQLVLVSLILDGLDGTLARLMRGQSPFGAELDTFVDLTSFGIAPAVLLYFYEPGGLQNVPFWGLALAFGFVMSGAGRLSRFRVVDPYRGQRGFLGLPITTAAGFVAAYVIALESVAGSGLPFSLSDGPLAAGFWCALLVLLVLQVSKIRYAKPTKNPKVFFPCLVLLVMLFIPSVALYSVMVILVYGVWYAFVSPFFFRRFLSRLPPVSAQVLEPASAAGALNQEEP